MQALRVTGLICAGSSEKFILMFKLVKEVGGWGVELSYNCCCDLISEFVLYLIQHKQGNCPYNICCLIQYLGIKQGSNEEIG